ncbi:MAG: epoxyqueuosine reductase QueH [Coriobacteriales bacterium]|nr:epoxyqueuosine reductase QueH [Coriobacteriales bacterium]
MRLALHACCGPCLLEPIDALSAEADEILVVYANPNIHPFEEYERRRDTLLAYASEHGIRVVEVAYDPTAWVSAVGEVVGDRAQRCRRCYRLRLAMAAAAAAEHGCDAIATTLTVSPYQDADSIAAEGRAAARDAGLAYVDRDFRDRYAEATRRSRDLGMYRQNYCGCVISDLEAREDREARRRQRREGRR